MKEDSEGGIEWVEVVRVRDDCTGGGGGGACGRGKLGGPFEFVLDKAGEGVGEEVPYSSSSVIGE